MGTKVILEEYRSMISKYDPTKNPQCFFKQSIDEYNTSFTQTAAVNSGVQVLSQNFGDYSAFVKSTEANQVTGLTTISYMLRFTKGNLFVNIDASGLQRQITDEKVIDLARKIETRIEGLPGSTAVDCSSVKPANATAPIDNSPKLSLIINSPSDTSQYLSNPVITLTNTGGLVTNLVFDVELLKNDKLVASESSVLLLSGTMGVDSLDTNASAKGYLNVMFYSGNTQNFIPGEYTLKVIVRQGVNANPLATAQQTVSFTG